MAYFTLYQDNKERYRFKLMGDGKLLAESEAYQSKKSAENGIASIKKNAGSAERFELKPGHQGGFYLSLKAGNGQVIAHSRDHVTESHAKQAQEAIMADAADAEVRDTTA